MSQPLPPPLTEEPPADRYADLVMTGGVASGVVYPWAVLELARHYRFRNIGGTSVGAMAAVLTAAAEYGRRRGHAQAFEPLRLLPQALAERPPHTRSAASRTRMLSLFQPAPQGRRLFGLLLAAIDTHYGNDRGGAPPTTRHWLRFGAQVLRAYGLWPLGGVLLPVAMLTALCVVAAPWGGLAGLVAALVALAAMLGLGVLVLGLGLLRDLQRGVADNDLGLCRGSSTERDELGRRLPALVDWLHEGVQASAGLRADEPPLTFEQLWHAPLTPGGAGPAVARDGSVRPQDRSIHLEMITSLISHGRPRRLPLRDRDARLFFDPEQWRHFFPPVILDALVRASEPYRPRSAADPPAHPSTQQLLELPGAKMPIVVAARLSLSFPVLFSALPVWAIDHEPAQPVLRPLRQGRFSDGGLSSNFPIEFFDVGWPGWPTFGIWLEPKSPYRADRFWRPRFMGQGRGDRWDHFEGAPDIHDRSPRAPTRRPTVGTLLSFLWACVSTSKDWRDRSQLRLPGTRTRVVRVQLARQERELNIGMPAGLIMDMAHAQGTKAGQALAQAFAPDAASGRPGVDWTEHLWARLCGLVDGLKGLLDGSAEALDAAAHAVRFDELLRRWQQEPPLRSQGRGGRLSADQAQRLAALMQQLQQLERDLQALPPLPQRPRPPSDFGLRPPL